MNLDLAHVTLAIVAALRRRWALSATVFFVTIVSATASFPLVIPRYQVHARLLTRDIPTLQSLAGSTHGGGKAIGATAEVIELTKSRSYRESILERSQLKTRWAADRPWLGRWKDRLILALGSSPTEQEFHEAMLEVLDEKIVVYLEENTIVFQVDWHTPHTAWLLADSGVQAFLDDRYREELGTLQDRRALLQSALEQTSQRVSLAMQDVETMMVSQEESNAEFTRPELRPRSPDRIPLSTELPPDMTEILQLRQNLEEIEGWLQAEESAYRSALELAEKRLLRLQESLGPKHPDIIDAEDSLAQQRAPSETLHALRQQREELAEQLRAREASLGTAALSPATSGRIADPSPLLHRDVPRPVHSGAQVAAEEATTTLKYWMEQRNEAERRLHGVQLELSAAQASFLLRYQLTIPPLPPRKPVSPQPLSSLLTALVIAGLLAVSAPILFELASGHTHDARLTAARLGIPLLGSIPRALLRGSEESARDPG